MENLASLNYIAAVIVGAGVTKLGTDSVMGLTFLGVAVVLIIVKAVLNKYGIPTAGVK